MVYRTYPLMERFRSTSLPSPHPPVMMMPTVLTLTPPGPTFRFDTSEVTLIRQKLKAPMAVKVVHPLRQPAGDVNPCVPANCSHVCLLTREGAVCKCPKV